RPLSPPDTTTWNDSISLAAAPMRAVVAMGGASPGRIFTSAWVVVTDGPEPVARAAIARRTLGRYMYDTPSARVGAANPSGWRALPNSSARVPQAPLEPFQVVACCR